jgi:hypothetical protein
MTTIAQLQRKLKMLNRQGRNLTIPFTSDLKIVYDLTWHYAFFDDSTQDVLTPIISVYGMKIVHSNPVSQIIYKVVGSTMHEQKYAIEQYIRSYANIEVTKMSKKMSDFCNELRKLHARIAPNENRCRWISKNFAIVFDEKQDPEAQEW